MVDSKKATNHVQDLNDITTIKDEALCYLVSEEGTSFKDNKITLGQLKTYFNQDVIKKPTGSILAGHVVSWGNNGEVQDSGVIAAPLKNATFGPSNSTIGSPAIFKDKLGKNLSVGKFPNPNPNPNPNPGNGSTPQQVVNTLSSSTSFFDFRTTTKTTGQTPLLSKKTIFTSSAGSPVIEYGKSPLWGWRLEPGNYEIGLTLLMGWATDTKKGRFRTTDLDKIFVLFSRSTQKPPLGPPVSVLNPYPKCPENTPCVFNHYSKFVVTNIMSGEFIFLSLYAMSEQNISLPWYALHQAADLKVANFHSTISITKLS